MNDRCRLHNREFAMIPCYESLRNSPLLRWLDQYCGNERQLFSHACVLLCFVKRSDIPTLAKVPLLGSMANTPPHPSRPSQEGNPICQAMSPSSLLVSNTSKLYGGFTWLDLSTIWLPKSSMVLERLRRASTALAVMVLLTADTPANRWSHRLVTLLACKNGLREL